MSVCSPDSTTRKTPKTVLKDLAAFGWFALLALFFTRPLASHLFTHLAGRIGDNIYFVWLIGWVEKAYFTLGITPLHLDWLNHPEGWSLASTEIAQSQLALAVPFSRLGGETFGFNLAMLLSFALSGWIFYAWLTSLTGSRLAGLISGTIFACLPYRQAHFLAGHLNLAGTQWLPLFFWGWFDLLRAGFANPDTPEPNQTRAALLAGLGIGLTALASQYYFFMTVLIAGFSWLVTLLFWQRDRLRSHRFWLTMALFVLTALPLLLVAEVPFLINASQGAMPDRDISSVRQYSASLSDFLLPATTHFALGNWIGATFHRDLWIEATLYVGVVSLGLFIFGWRRRKSETDPAIRHLWKIILLCLLTATIFAMGTDLHWNERAVELTLPAQLAARLGRETLPIVLPGFFFFKYFPFFAKIRAMMRFGLFTGMFLAVGAGLAVANQLRNGTLRKDGRKRVILVIVLIGLILLDFTPKRLTELSPVTARPVDSWLATQPDYGAVMRIPYELNDDQAGTYYTLIHGKPFVGGFFNAFPTRQYRETKDVFASFPSPESIALAQDMGIGYILIERAEDGDRGANEAERLATVHGCLEAGMKIVYDDGDVTVVRPPDAE